MSPKILGLPDKRCCSRLLVSREHHIAGEELMGEGPVAEHDLEQLPKGVTEWVRKRERTKG